MIWQGTSVVQAVSLKIKVAGIKLHMYWFVLEVRINSSENRTWQLISADCDWCTSQLRGGADKSLARPGRKQATATKLGNYLTYSPRSSVHFLARCSNFCKPLKKKKIGKLSVQPGLRGSNDLHVGRKMTNCFFQSRIQVVVQRGQIRRIGWVIKTLEAQVGQFLLGCKCPVSWGIVVQEQDPLGDLSAAFFHQNVLQLHQQGWVILRVDSLALWKIMRRKPSWSQKKIEARTFPEIFALGIFWGRGEPPLHWLLLCDRIVVI